MDFDGAGDSVTARSTDIKKGEPSRPRRLAATRRSLCGSPSLRGIPDRSAPFRAESPAHPCSQTPAVVAVEFFVNRLDLAPKVGHLGVATDLVLGELRHRARIVIRDTGPLSSSGEAVHASCPLAPLE
jgi:hypothetical protein